MARRAEEVAVLVSPCVGFFTETSQEQDGGASEAEKQILAAYGIDFPISEVLKAFYLVIDSCSTSLSAGRESYTHRTGKYYQWDC